MVRFAPLAALVPLAVAAIGCSSSPRQQAAAADVAAADATVVARDVAFVNPPRQLPAGPVTLALDNQSSARHDLTIENPRTRVAAAEGGRSSAGTVTLAPGTYTVYCSVGGHRQAGMEFEVTVG